jgi:hypothetical protein
MRREEHIAFDIVFVVELVSDSLCIAPPPEQPNGKLVANTYVRKERLAGDAGPGDRS